jgi:predicted kinase
VADATASDLAELRCAAPSAVTDRRIRDRLARGGDPSDATPAVAAAMARHFDPWPAASTIGTAGTLAASLAEALGVTAPAAVTAG